MYHLSFRIFEQLALALKTEFSLKFFKPGEAAAPTDPPPRTPMSKCEYLFIGSKREVVGMPFHNAIGYRLKQWCGSFVQHHHRLRDG